MSSEETVDLARCTEAQRALVAPPPRVLRATLVMLVALAASAAIWSALTTTELVVVAPGRVRPRVGALKDFDAVSGDAVATEAGGRVVEVHAVEGDRVRRGDALLRLNTEKLDNEIARLELTIQAGQAEAAKLERLCAMIDEQHAEARAKAGSELAQAEGEVAREKARHAADLRLAGLEVARARDDEERTRALTERGALARIELEQATARRQEADERRSRAAIGVDERRVDIARRALALVTKEHALRREEVELRLAARRGEVEAATRALANLRLERERSVVHAPFDGVVTVGRVRAGDLVQAGAVVFAIAAEKGLRMDAAVRGEDVALLRPGMKARIKLDAYDYQQYGTIEGEVSDVSPDAEIDGSSRGSRYLVRIALEQDEVGRGALRGPLKFGMTGRVEIVVGEERLLWLAVRGLRHSARTR